MNEISTPREADGFTGSRRHAWFVFALCFALMAFDFIHRQIVVAAFPLLKAEWHLSDAQLGALVSAVALTAGLGALPVAFLADRWSRVHSIVVMGVIWSLATIAAAFAGSYAQLFAARAVIGMGEAGYGPAGSALLATLFPARMRATILGAFAAAGALGAVLGVLLGGVLSAAWGWRTAFAVVGLPGLLISLGFLLVKDPDAKPAKAARAEGPGVITVMRAIFAARSGTCAYVAAALQLFVVATVVSWLPTFLTRAYHYDTARAGTIAAAIVLIGTVATVAWGYAADRGSLSNPNNRLYIPAIGAAASFALFTAAFGLVSPGTLQLGLIAGGSLFMTVTIGSVGAVVIDVVRPDVRATAMSMITVSQNLFGMAVGPLITGVLSDSYGLGVALAVVPVFSLAAAAFLLLAATSYRADRRRAAAGEV